MEHWERFQKIIDRLESRWSLYLAIAGTGAVTATLAAVTDWLDAWGPIGWGIGFLIGALVAALVVYLLAYAKYKRVISNTIARSIAETNTNPLDTEFEKKVIRMVDFYNREYFSHSHKRFKDCNVTGPGNIIFVKHVYMNACDFRHCQIVLTDTSQPLFGVTVFEDCQFINCQMSNLTLFFPPDMYENLDPELRKYIPVVSCGLASIDAPQKPQ